MQRNGILMLALIAGCLVVITGTVFAAGETLSRAAIVSGGGRVSNSAQSLASAIGQPVAGAVANANNTLCSGIHCSAAAAAATPTPGPSPTGSVTPGTPGPTPTGSVTPGTPGPTPTGSVTPGTPGPTPTGTVTPDAHLFVPNIWR